MPIPRYGNEADLLHDIAICYQKAIRAFYDAGCRYLQLDDTSWGELCSQEKRKAYTALGIDVDALAHKYVDMINLSLEAKPDDMVITMHICRGNFRSTWSHSGGYEARGRNAVRRLPCGRLLPGVRFRASRRL